MTPSSTRPRPRRPHGDELVLHYQPYRERATGLFTHAEALIRWNHPQHGLLYPGAFLGLAAAAGLMRDIDRWSLDRACHQLKIWRAQGIDLVIAVNASRDSVRDPNYVTTLEKTLARHGIPASAIEVEITEEAVFFDPEQATQFTTAVASLGVKLAIDDYGTGYSSLSRLRELPVNALKIDRSFIGAALTDPKSAAIIESTVVLAHRLGLAVVAEGIEDDATLAYVDSLEIEYAQGFGICRPIPAADLAPRLVHRRPTA